MPSTNGYGLKTLTRDLVAGTVVFLVALPLCLGVALASGAPLFAGVLAGIVGGLLVGALSGSHVSVSGPAAGLTAVVASQIRDLGSFNAFLLAVTIAGVMQIALGIFRAGFIAAYFPSSVIKGLLAAIGVIIILKQIPHLLGHDTDPEGEMAFLQPDDENTFSEVGQTFFDINEGAALIGLTSLVLLIVWGKVHALKKSIIPAPLVVVILGVAMNLLLRRWGGHWVIADSHLVSVPVAQSIGEFLSFLQWPDFSQWRNPAIYTAAVTIALVASLETLLNLEAVDKIDPKQRSSPPSRELWAQGVGNMAVGLLGGIPITSVIVRSSVNIMAGGETKGATVVHGSLLLLSVLLLPTVLNLIPLSSLAAILIVTGAKLASWKLLKQMWLQGRYQFVPFIVTVIAIVLTDLLIGILIGLAVSVSFILNSNLRRPTRRVLEKHLGGEVLHIQLANQVSFLNRAALAKVLDGVPRGGNVLLDALDTDYIDPDVLDLIRDFEEKKAPARGIKVSFRGFRNKYGLEDRIQYVDYSTREVQNALTPESVLDILKEGNERFRTGQRLTRDLGRQLLATADGQNPIAVILSCIDSRAPVELIFDLGLGDVLSVRMAGSILSRKVLGSMEYGCAVAGAKLILVVGHTRCGAVTTAVRMACGSQPIAQATGCEHLEFIVRDIQKVIDPAVCKRLDRWVDGEANGLIDKVARASVEQTVRHIVEGSATLARLVREGRIAIVGAMYDVASGKIEYL